MYEEEELLAKTLMCECGKKKMYGLLFMTKCFPKYSVFIRTSADAPHIHFLFSHKWDFVLFKIYGVKQKKKKIWLLPWCRS